MCSSDLRVISPGGEKILDSGRFAATRKGPTPNTHPDGAAASMSGLAADLAEKLAQAINAARQNGAIGRAFSPHPGPFPKERENHLAAKSPTTDPVSSGRTGCLSWGRAADEVSVKNKSDCGRGEGKGDVRTAWIRIK